MQGQTPETQSRLNRLVDARRAFWSWWFINGLKPRSASPAYSTRWRPLRERCVTCDVAWLGGSGETVEYDQIARRVW